MKQQMIKNKRMSADGNSRSVEPRQKSNHRAGTTRRQVLGGNHSVLAARGVSVQPKLAVSAPSDKYEREADRVAEAVLRTPKSEPVARSVDGIQPKADSGEGLSVERGMRSPNEFLNNGGKLLSPSSRLFFEQRFGRDFGEVRIHTDKKADRLVQSLNAKAFTYGEQVAFENGAYDPTSVSGKRLIAHELCHVVQQSQTNSRQIQCQKKKESSAVPDPTKMKEKVDTLPLEDPLTPEGVKNAPFNMAAFFEGLVSIPRQSRGL